MSNAWCHKSGAFGNVACTSIASRVKVALCCRKAGAALSLSRSKRSAFFSSSRGSLNGSLNGSSSLKSREGRGGGEVSDALFFPREGNEGIFSKRR